MLKSFKANNPPLLMGKNTSEFDHSRWLFETKGTYGYGNALWPKDGAYNARAGGNNRANSQNGGANSAFLIIFHLPLDLFINSL